MWRPRPASYGARMSTAQRILVGYGTGVLAYGLLLGVALAAARSKSPSAPRALVTSHLAALMQGPVHLGLAAAIGLTGFDSGAATVGAALLVAGSGLETAGGTVNWVQRVDDQFALRSAGYRLNALSAPVAIAGLAIVGAGVAAGL